MSNIKTIMSYYRKEFDLIDIKLLLCFVLKKDLNFLISNDDYILSLVELNKLKKLFNKRKE
jgi:hypothetical protein